MDTQTIEVKGKLTKDQCDTITAAAHWIERISNRKEELPELFMDNLDPAPIGKKLRRMVKENTKALPSIKFDKADHPFDKGYWARYDGKDRPTTEAEAAGWDALDAELLSEQNRS